MCDIKISLVLPVYNVNRYISRCLESIMSQITDNRIEIILVDDESPDNSIAVALDYVNQYYPFVMIKVIRQTNRGLGGARNTGLKNASGEYIWFIDSDDEISSGIIEIMLEKINGEDIIIYDYETINSSNERCVKTSSMNDLIMLSGAEIEQHFVLSQAWRSLYRRLFLLDYSLYFREKFLHEDGEFNMRAMCLAQKVTYVPIVAYRYYMRNIGSIMNSLNQKNQTDLLLYFQTVQNIQKKYPALSCIQKEVLQRHALSALCLLFYNATKLSKADMVVFKKILSEKRNEIIKNIDFSSLSFFKRFSLYIQLYCPYRIVYSFIYLKHF